MKPVKFQEKELVWICRLGTNR